MLSVNKYIVIIFLFDTYKNDSASSPYYYVLIPRWLHKYKKKKKQCESESYASQVKIFNNTNNMTFMFLNKFSLTSFAALCI